MNNQEYNSFKKKMNVYKNFVNTSTLNRLSNRVRTGKLEPGQGLTNAKNKADIEHQKKQLRFYSLIAQDILKRAPAAPPCIPVNGSAKSGIRKTGEAVTQICGDFCAKQAKKACGAVSGAVGGTARTVRGATGTMLGAVGGVFKKKRRERSLPMPARSPTLSPTLPPAIRIEMIRNLVKNGVLKNIVSKNKNSTRSNINRMSENRLITLARNKNVTIPRSLRKPT